MIIEVFISILLIFCGLACIFVPRNSHIGFRTPKTYSSDYVWNRANKISGVLFTLLGLAFLVLSFMGLSLRDFFFGLSISFVPIAIFLNRVISLDYERAKAQNLIDFGKDAPINKSQKKKKSKEDGLTFSSSKKFSAMFCSFCAFLIFLSYSWIVRSLEFFPDKIAIHFNINDVADGFILKDSYAYNIKIFFWCVQLANAIGLLIVSMFFAKSKFLNKPFSLQVSLSDIIFAYASSFAILFALINYLILARNLNEVAGFEFVFSEIISLMAIFTVWTILFARHLKSYKK